VKTLTGLRSEAIGAAAKESRTNFKLHPISASRRRSKKEGSLQ
jgi:hypothetical protein